MARRSPQTQAKRQREFEKAQKRQDKAEKRALRKAMKSKDPNVPDDGEEAANPDQSSPDSSKPDPSQGEAI